MDTNCRQTRWVSTTITAVGAPLKGRETWDAQQHTTISSFKLCLCPKKTTKKWDRKEGSRCYRFTTEERRKKCLKMSTKKSDLVCCSHFSHTLTGEKERAKIPDDTGLGSIKTHFSTGWSCTCVQAHARTHTQTVRNLILLKIIPPRWKKTNKQKTHGFVSPSEST